MKRTLVTALLLPFFLLTVGSLGCKAAALPLSGPVAAAMAEEGLTVNPSTIQHFSVRKNGTTHRRCGAAHLRDVPPLTKGRCFIPSRMKQRGNTPRKCGVYGHCRDSTSEVSAECAECIDVPPTRTVAAATVAQHDEVVMFLRQPSAATSLCEEGLSSTQQSACYSQQAGALERLTRQKPRQLWEEHLSDALPQTARQQLEDWYGQEPFEQNRWDWGEVWQQLNRSIQDKLRTLLHELLDEPLRLLGTLIGMVVLCAVLGALRQNGTTSGMDEPFSVVAAASALVLLGEPVFGCVERTVQSLRECSLFVMSFAPVLSGILIAGGSPASAGAYNLMLYFVSQLLAELASKTLLPLLGVYLALCILSPLAPFLQVGQLTRAIHRLTCWGLGVLTTLFVGILSLQTVIGSGGDGILLKTSKFLVGSFVPVIGGTLSDAMGAARSCLHLMKGLVGSLGMAVAALTFLPVLIEVSGWYLILHTAAWAAQMLDCSRMSGVLRSVASAFSILLALVVCFGLLVLVSTTMVLSVGVA